MTNNNILVTNYMLKLAGVVCILCSLDQKYAIKKKHVLKTIFFLFEFFFILNQRGSLMESKSSPMKIQK